MRKNSQPNVDKENLNVQRASIQKRSVRTPRKTVLAIASAGSNLEHFDSLDEESAHESDAYLNRDGTENGAAGITQHCYLIAPELAIDFACKLVKVALQLRNWSSSSGEYFDNSKTLETALDEFSQAANLPSTCSGILPRLSTLLTQLHQNHVQISERSATTNSFPTKQILTNAIHAVVAAMSQAAQFQGAVELASQRAIYQFAYGLTHEINNPLANIAARAQQLIASASSDADRRSLATIVDQSMRAHEMLAEMMRVVKPRTIQTRTENMVSLIQNAVSMYEQRSTIARIQISLRFPAKPLFCSVEIGSMTETICCILQNSLQVCRPNDRIEVICHEVEQDHPDYGPAYPSAIASETLDEGSDAKKTPRIRIAIRDTGPGMSSETAERAWDLYFSGREHGRGLGISLANVRRTVDAHHGLIWIQSKQNAGCSVEIRLPKSPEPSNPRKAISI